MYVCMRWAAYKRRAKSAIFFAKPRGNKSTFGLPENETAGLSYTKEFPLRDDIGIRGSERDRGMKWSLLFLCRCTEDIRYVCACVFVRRRERL